MSQEERRCSSRPRVEKDTQPKLVPDYTVAEERQWLHDHSMNFEASSPLSVLDPPGTRSFELVQADSDMPQ